MHKERKRKIMKFSYAIGNPPYQETKGGTNNIDIWPQFLAETNKISNKICMIHPGRWVVPTKTFLKRHQEILNSGLKAFNYFPNSNDAFANVSIDGGISITLTENNYRGDIRYYINGEDLENIVKIPLADKGDFYLFIQCRNEKSKAQVDYITEIFD